MFCKAVLPFRQTVRYYVRVFKRSNAVDKFSSFCTIWQSRTDNTAAVNSSLGIDTALIGATRALPMTKEQWILSLQLTAAVLSVRLCQIVQKELKLLL